MSGPVHPPTGSDRSIDPATHARSTLSALPLERGDRIVVAFSGGPDSLALLVCLAELAPTLGFSLHAAHYDHRFDDASGDRALRARELSARLRVPFHVGGRPIAPTPPLEPLPPAARTRERSPEAVARELRYVFLEEIRSSLGARYVATGHHLDDQAETVLLRILLGTGTGGLAAIRPRRGFVIRPLLGCRRRDLAAFLRARALEPIHDPTNDDLAVPRNLIRHRVLPALTTGAPDLPRRLAALATRAQAAQRVLRRRLRRHLEPERTLEGVAVLRTRLETLPPELLAPALALLQRRAGALHPPRRGAREELRRQLCGARRVGCDGGAGWRWEQQGRWVSFGQARAPTAPFTYTLKIPGTLTIPELGLEMSLTRPVSGRDTAGPATARDLSLGVPDEVSALVDLPLSPGDEVTVRNRRPGDRLRPPGLGCEARLKEVLINRKVPRSQRDSLPILCVDGNIAWVAGVVTDERFRAREPAWLVTVKPAEGIPR